MDINVLLASELQQEGATTRRMLERVPEDSFAWKPHEKSTPLGRLAGHIAELPSLVVMALTQDEVDFAAGDFKPFMPKDVSDLLATFDKHIANGVEMLRAQPDENFLKTWRLRSGEKILFEMPRLAAIRSIAINHLIHHRGQLSVYLRLLNVPLPSVYGPTADEQMP